MAPLFSLRSSQIPTGIDHRVSFRLERSHGITVWMAARKAWPPVPPTITDPVTGWLVERRDKRKPPATHSPCRSRWRIRNNSSDPLHRLGSAVLDRLIGNRAQGEAPDNSDTDNSQRPAHKLLPEIRLIRLVWPILFVTVHQTSSSTCFSTASELAVISLITHSAVLPQMIDSPRRSSLSL